MDGLGRYCSYQRLIMWTAMIAALALAGYQQIFSTFAPYDDESYVMLSLSRYMEGDALYDVTYSQYGPGFFAIQSAVHRTLGWVISHDVTRLKTLGLWLVISVLGSLFIHRITRNELLALIGLVCGFCHLDKFCLEPGHPQELCGLAFAVVLVVSTFLNAPRRRLAASLALGATTGVIATTKINAGGLVGLSIALTLLAQTSGRPARWAYAGLVAVCGVAPWLLCWANLTDLASMRLPLACSALCVATSFAATRLPRPDDGTLTWSAVMTFVVASVATTVAFIAIGLSHGTSVGGMLYGLIGQHGGFSATFFHAAPLFNLVFPVCVMSGVLLWVSRGSGTCSPGFVTLRGAAVLLALSIATLGYLVTTATPLQHGLMARGGAGAMFSIAGPILWFLLLPTAANPSFISSRLLLCFGCALWPLSAYPTPGTQFDLALFPLVLGLLIGLHDFMNHSGTSADKTRSAHRRWNPRWATIGLMIISLCTVGYRDLAFSVRRAGLTPLDLPGASLLRLESQVARQQQWLTKTLQENCETFVFAQHGHNRFYFWTQLPPPTSINPTFWPFLLSSADQERIVAALDKYDHVCLVAEDYAVELPHHEAPLTDYFASHFEATHSNYGWIVKTRREE